jgi:hypothetical protein
VFCCRLQPLLGYPFLEGEFSISSIDSFVFCQPPKANLYLTLLFPNAASDSGLLSAKSQLPL